MHKESCLSMTEIDTQASICKYVWKIGELFKIGREGFRIRSIRMTGDQKVEDYASLSILGTGTKGLAVIFLMFFGIG
ncbi:hypothetical protein CUMW_271980 [Citrus unshiu]|uniref:Uncharacterized protein n=1 Tax=Citrus unshiu TaxID=55188 RepID=A0A2H5QXT7_CITUN|nr:hypothetical protein CUMW_271980 [Citrus unshiu]